MTASTMASVAIGESLTSPPAFINPPDRSLPREGQSRVAGELAGTLGRRARAARANPTLVPTRSFSSGDVHGMCAPCHQGALDSFLLYVARSVRLARTSRPAALPPPPLLRLTPSPSPPVLSLLPSQFSMDIGELWSLDLASSLRMTNMYIAPDFYERHSARILYPDSDPRANPSRQHRFSRGLCMRAVVRGEPLWCDVSSPPATPQTPPAAADEGAASVELPLRTALVLPFTTSPSGTRDGAASSTAVLVLYSQRYKPLPSPQVMATLSAFAREVATQRSMAHFLSTLSTRLETFDAPGSEAQSVSDRLGLTSSASTPACLHELGALPDKPPPRQSASEPAPTPTVAPPAPSLRGQAGSTFAQRRMRQMLAEHDTLPALPDAERLSRLSAERRDQLSQC